ncbi:MAG: hypothetical protein GX143_01305, partial [Alcaligenaceae bacterium]|nr:hypothetical protein [Alcaligenaceae bacterium]
GLGTANTNISGLTTRVDDTEAEITTLKTTLTDLGVAEATPGIKYFRVNSDKADASATGDDSVAIGPQAVSSGLNSVALGFMTQAQAENAFAAGFKAIATESGAIALGQEAQAQAENAFAAGTNALVSAQNATAVGANTDATGVNASAFGNGAQAIAGSALALGDGAVAEGLNSTAMGTGANAQKANSMALGTNATAYHEGSVALGSGSVTGTVNVTRTPDATVDGVKYDFAGAQTSVTSTVSVGSVGNERTISNVAAGQLNEGSTDAINGSQLHATNKAVTALGNNLDTFGASVAASLGGTSSYDPVKHTVTAGLSVNGNDYTKVNEALQYVGQGWNVSDSSGKNQVNIGPNGGVDFQGDSNISVAQTGAKDAGVIAINLAKDVNLGADGSLTTGNTKVNNNGVSFVNNEGDQVGPSVSVDGINAGGKTITNVAPGVNETDAVNVGQLQGAVTNINNQINSVRGDLRRVDKDARAGTASAAAMANLPQAYLPGKSMFAVASAGHRGEQGFAAGLSTISDNGKWVLKGSVSGNSRGDTTYGAGVGYQW